MMTIQTIAPRESIHHDDHPNCHTKGLIHKNNHPNHHTKGGQFITMTTPSHCIKGASGDQLENWQLATRCHCCCHYNIIMNSNQIVYHKYMYNAHVYNMYNMYVYNIMIGISLAGLNIMIGIAQPVSQSVGLEN